MKNFVTIALISLSTIASVQAGEISKEEFIKLLENHKNAFEAVEVGMSAQTYKRLIVRGENANEMCSMFLNEIIVSVDYPSYSILSEEYYLSDCGPNRKAGKMNSYVSSTRAFTLDEYVEELRTKKEQHKYSFSSRSEVTVTWGDPSVEFPPSGSEVIALGVSQFYNVKSYDGIIIDTTLLGRGWVKPERVKEEYELSK